MGVDTERITKRLEEHGLRVHHPRFVTLAPIEPEVVEPTVGIGEQISNGDLDQLIRPIAEEALVRILDGGHDHPPIDNRLDRYFGSKLRENDIFRPGDPNLPDAINDIRNQPQSVKVWMVNRRATEIIMEETFPEDHFSSLSKKDKYQVKRIGRRLYQAMRSAVTYIREDYPRNE